LNSKPQEHKSRALIIQLVWRFLIYQLNKFHSYLLELYSDMPFTITVVKKLADMSVKNDANGDVED